MILQLRLGYRPTRTFIGSVPMRTTSHSNITTSDILAVNATLYRSKPCKAENTRSWIGVCLLEMRQRVMNVRLSLVSQFQSVLPYLWGRPIFGTCWTWRRTHDCGDIPRPHPRSFRPRLILFSSLKPAFCLLCCAIWPMFKVCLWDTGGCTVTLSRLSS